MLDVDMLVPPDASGSRVGGYLSVNFHNRSDAPCWLDGWSPKVFDGKDMVDIPYSRENRDDSSIATEFRAKHNVLGPDEDAHFIMAWSAVPIVYQNYAWGSCTSIDNLTVGAGSPSISSLLNVRHLWIRTCGGFFRSEMREGKMLADEPIPQSWLDQYSIQREDLASPEEVTEVASSKTLSLRPMQEIEYLKSTFESGYAGYVVLILQRAPAEIATCPFRSLRRREENGETTILINHCETVGKVNPAIADGHAELHLPEYDLLPQRTGRVEYTVVAGTKTLQAVTTSIDVRDSTLTMLPETDSSVPLCKASQLSAVPAPVDLGTHWKNPDAIGMPGEKPWQDGRAFQFTNTSDTTCRLGGLPTIHFDIRGAQAANRHWNGGVCRNCETTLFKPRDSQWIHLKPSETAHFLVAVTAFEGRFIQWCNWLDGVELQIGGEQYPRIPFDTATCGQIALSAWRAGAFDGDPFNLTFDKRLASDQKLREASAPEPPADCLKNITDGTGTPVMFPSTDDIEVGFSTGPAASNQGTPVHMWVHNRSGKKLTLMSCGSEGLFEVYDLLDPAGNRVLTRSEAAAAKAGRPASTYRGPLACTANIPYELAPHSCTTSGLMSLANTFAATPGHFYLVPAPAKSPNGEIIEPAGPRAMPPAEPNLEVVIGPN